MSDELLLSINPARVVVEPGGVAEVALQIQNRSSVVDEFEVEVLGDAATWTTVDKARVPIFPEGTGSVQVTMRPPRTSHPEAGKIAVGFRVRSAVDPDRSVVEECSVELKPFVEIAGEISPKTARGRFSASHQLRVINKGNALVSVDVRAEVQQGDCKVSLPEGPLLVAAGERKTARVKVRPSSSHWQGGDEMHQYRLSLEPQGGTPVALDAMMRQRPIARIPTSLLVAAALLLLGAYAVYGKTPNPLQTALHWTGSVATSPSPAATSPATPTQSAPPTQQPPPVVVADISVNPTTLDWSPLSGAAGALLAAHVSNGASNGQATVTGFQVQGDASYVIDSTTTCAVGMTLSPGQQCNIVVAFRPQAKGPHDAELLVTATAGGGVKTVQLTYMPPVARGMPHVYGLSGTAAQAALSNAGYVAGLKSVCLSGVTAGLAYEVVSPVDNRIIYDSSTGVTTAGLSLPPGSSVTVLVAQPLSGCICLSCRVLPSPIQTAGQDVLGVFRNRPGI